MLTVLGQDRATTRVNGVRNRSLWIIIDSIAWKLRL
jgi:hypothetical protein